MTIFLDDLHDYQLGDLIRDEQGSIVGVLGRFGVIYCYNELTATELSKEIKAQANPSLREKVVIASEIQKKAKETESRQYKRVHSELRNLSDMKSREVIVDLSKLPPIQREIVHLAIEEQAFVENPYNFLTLLSVFSAMYGSMELSEKSRRVKLQSIRDSAESLWKKGLAIVLREEDGTYSVKISRERLSDILRYGTGREWEGGHGYFNLIRGKLQNSNFSKIDLPIDPYSEPSGDMLDAMKERSESESESESESPKKKTSKRSPFDLPTRCSKERLCACRRMNKTLRYADVREGVFEDFGEYNDACNDKGMLFLNEKTGDHIYREYSTRFNDKKKSVKNIQKFETAFTKSFESYNRAVFLTLTTDPRYTAEMKQAIIEQKIRSYEYKMENMSKHKNFNQLQFWQYEQEWARLHGIAFEWTYFYYEIEKLTSMENPSKKRLEFCQKRYNQLRDATIYAVNTYEQMATGQMGVRDIEIAYQELFKWGYELNPYIPEELRHKTKKHDAPKTLYEYNRMIGESWNKFLSWLMKKNDKRRPDYICSYEYTKNGLIHIHAIIFMDNIGTQREITREWARIGQGYLAYVYSLRAFKTRSGWSWNWSKERPTDAKNKSAQDYLKKYLKKSVLCIGTEEQTEVQSLYWVHNKRFFTTSRGLSEPLSERVATQKMFDEKLKDAIWTFMGTISLEIAPYFAQCVYNRGLLNKGNSGTSEENGGIK